MKILPLLLVLLAFAGLAFALPNWSNLAINSTVPGQAARVTASWTFTGSSGNCWGLLALDNGNGTYYNYTSATNFCGGSPQTLQSDFIVNASGGTVRYGQWANDSTGNSPFNFTGFLNFTNTPVYIAAFDEQTSAVLAFNYSITNGSITVSGNNVSNGLIGIANLPTGNDTLSITATVGGYQQRQYMFNSNGTALNLTTYLLATSQGQLVQFVIVSTTGVNIQGASLSGFKIVNGADVLVAQATSDSFGVATLFLSPTTNYDISVSAPGYSSGTLSITPSGTQYKITLTPTTASVAVPQTFQNLTYFFFPAGNIVNASGGNQTFGFYINDPNSGLNFTQFVLYFNGSVIFNQTNSSAPTGGWINVSINATYYANFSQTLPVLVGVGNFIKNGTGPLSVSASWLLTNGDYSVYSLQGTLDYLTQNPSARIGIFLVGMVGTAVVATMLAGSSIISALIALSALAFLTLAGVLNTNAGLPGWGLFSVTALTVVSLFYLRRVI